MLNLIISVQVYKMIPVKNMCLFCKATVRVCKWFSHSHFQCSDTDSDLNSEPETSVQIMLWYKVVSTSLANTDTFHFSYLLEVKFSLPLFYIEFSETIVYKKIYSMTFLPIFLRQMVGYSIVPAFKRWLESKIKLKYLI